MRRTKSMNVDYQSLSSEDIELQEEEERFFEEMCEAWRDTVADLLASTR